jgi:uncharacterized membrane protein YccF (DUF307 family)
VVAARATSRWLRRLAHTGQPAARALGGREVGLDHVVSAIVNIMTIIGIPFGVQHLKVAGCALAPVGKTVVSNNEAVATKHAPLIQVL